MKYILILVFFPLVIFAENVPYVNWENHPVHAVDVSPDKTRLAVAHTADNRVQLFDISLGYPTRLGHVKVGVDPVSVRFKNNNEIWVVNHISDSVTVIDFENKKIIATLQTNDEPFDVVFANNKAFVSCSQANQVLVFNTNNLNASPQVIDVFAEDPRAMVVNNDGTKVYVASFESGNKTTIMAGGINEDEGVLGFPGNPVNREASPYAGQNPPPNDGSGFNPVFNDDLPTPPRVSLIIKQQPDGRWLDDNGEDWTHMVSGDQAQLSGRLPGWKLLDHDITVIDTNTHEVSYIEGLMNIGMALGFNSARNEITLVGTDATNEIRYEPVLNGKFIRVKMGVIAENNLNNPIVVDLNPHLNYQSSSINQTERNKSIGDPRGIVWSENGMTGYITGMGSNNVIIVDSNGQRTGQIEVGEGATGIVIDEDNNRLYVWNHFEASLSTIDLDISQQTRKTQLFNPLPESIKQGRKFLYSTHDTSGLGQASCASCHVDARMDKLAWDLGDPAGEMKEFNQNCQTTLLATALFDCEDFHPMKGPMMTQTFQDIIGNEPFHWRGDRNGIEEFNGAFISINGDDSLLTANEMSKFKAMLSTITFPPNPFRNLDNTLPESIDLKDHYTSGRFSDAGQPMGSGNPQNGLELFNLGLLDTVFQCGSCHTIPTGMAVNGPLMLGTIGASVGGEIMPMGPGDSNHLGIVSVDGSTQTSIKTPQLRNLYEKVGFEMSRPESISGFGFLHDGAIDSVGRFISAPTFDVDSDQEVADVVAFMMAFSGSELDDGSIPFGNTPEESQDTHAGVGKQYSLIEATQDDENIDLMVSIAMSEKVDLIVNATNGINYFFNSGNQMFVSQNGEEISSLGLMSLANQNISLSYTLVPRGLGQRLAFDRDGDGVYDHQEITNGSDLTDANSTTVKPTTGLWYNPQRSGHGLDVQFLGENMFVVWYTYNDDGSPIWYLASAAYDQNWSADIVSYTWDWQNSGATGQVVGNINLNFINAEQSELSWDIGGRTGSESIEYFNVSNLATAKQFTGVYYDVDDPGWGLSVYTQGSAQVAVVYYYDENGKPRWVLGNGDNTRDSEFEMLSYRGFCPDCTYVSPTSEIIGQVELLYNADRTINLSTQLNYSGLNQNNWSASDVIFTALSDEFFDAKVQ